MGIIKIVYEAIAKFHCDNVGNARNDQYSLIIIFCIVYNTNIIILTTIQCKQLILFMSDHK